jgi:nicotinamidase/pyrazinamidase
MKALIVVDAQNDFMPATVENYESGQGGALAVPDGDQIIPVINELLPKFDLVIFTQDWHPTGMKGFASSHKGKQPFDTYKVNGKTDTLWPDHCIKESYGAMIHEGIDFGLINGDFYIFKKGEDVNKHPYSAFDGTGLSFFLQDRGVTDIFVTGLATDFCCKDTAIDGAWHGFKSTLILDACRSINPDLSETIIELTNNNVKLIESWELPLFNLL